jgi:hypothetical protein
VADILDDGKAAFRRAWDANGWPKRGSVWLDPKLLDDRSPFLGIGFLYARPETVRPGEERSGRAWEAHSTSRLGPFGSFTPRMRRNKMRAKDFEHNQGVKR